MVEPDNKEGLSINRQCRLFGISRSSWYYKDKGPDEEELKLMRIIDEQYLKTPLLRKQEDGGISKKTRLQGRQEEGSGSYEEDMGIEALYARPRTTKRNKGHKIR